MSGLSPGILGPIVILILIMMFLQNLLFNLKEGIVILSGIELAEHF